MASNFINILQLVFFTLGYFLNLFMLKHMDLVIHFDCCIVFLRITTLHLFIHFSTNGNLGAFFFC